MSSIEMFDLALNISLGSWSASCKFGSYQDVTITL